MLLYWKVSFLRHGIENSFIYRPILDGKINISENASQGKKKGWF